MGNQFLEAAIETALEAGGILLSEFDRPAKVSRKGKLDLVTEADHQSEQAKLFPQAHYPIGGRRRAGGRYAPSLDCRPS